MRTCRGRPQEQERDNVLCREGAKRFIRFDSVMFSTHIASRAITQPHNSDAEKELAMKFFCQT